jgi:hypothetical protein
VREIGPHRGRRLEGGISVNNPCPILEEEEISARRLIIVLWLNRKPRGPFHSERRFSIHFFRRAGDAVNANVRHQFELRRHKNCQRSQRECSACRRSPRS